MRTTIKTVAWCHQGSDKLLVESSLPDSSSLALMLKQAPHALTARTSAVHAGRTAEGQTCGVLRLCPDASSIRLRMRTSPIPNSRCSSSGTTWIKGMLIGGCQVQLRFFNLFRLSWKLSREAALAHGDTLARAHFPLVRRPISVYQFMSVASCRYRFHLCTYVHARLT